MTPITTAEIQLVFGAFALAFSLISLIFTRVNWVQSNRPIVVAYIAEHHAGNEAATFNLVLANTGSRPAVRVRIVASHENIRALLAPNVEEARFKMIESIFLHASEVPLLENGQRLETSFGAYLPRTDSPWLNYGAQTDILITYDDLEGRSFKSALPVRVYARDGFGGGVWGDPSTSSTSHVFHAPE
jgi:hypothetical protein